MNILSMLQGGVMEKRIFFILIIALVVTSICASAFAGLIDWERRNHYLKEQQSKEASVGSAQTKEMTQADLPKWMKEEPKVMTRDEQRYDINRDGYFQPAESKVYLRRLVGVVEQRGKIASNSELLKEYDKNGDGVITRTEAKKIREDAF